MNSILHIHVHAENKDILFLMRRHTNDLTTLFINKLIVDGREMKEDMRQHFLEAYNITILGELSRKLSIRKNQLNICESQNEYI